jgi:uncharacterized protein (TIGR02588 family)
MSNLKPLPLIDSPGQRQSPAKWITFGISSAILAALVSLVIYAGIVTQNRPPILKVEMIQPLRVVAQQFYVPFTVTNEGGASAEAIQIVAELRVAGEVDETGEQQIDLLSGGETIQGSFVFSHDPREGKLRLRVASYREPQATPVLSPVSSSSP